VHRFVFSFPHLQQHISEPSLTGSGFTTSIVKAGKVGAICDDCSEEGALKEKEGKGVEISSTTSSGKGVG
jgi:hypothetical protein